MRSVLTAAFAALALSACVSVQANNPGESGTAGPGDHLAIDGKRIGVQYLGTEGGLIRLNQGGRLLTASAGDRIPTPSGALILIRTQDGELQYYVD